MFKINMNSAFLYHRIIMFLHADILLYYDDCSLTLYRIIIVFKYYWASENNKILYVISFIMRRPCGVAKTCAVWGSRRRDDEPVLSIYT